VRLGQVWLGVSGECGPLVSVWWLLLCLGVVDGVVSLVLPVGVVAGGGLGVVVVQEGCVRGVGVGSSPIVGFKGLASYCSVVTVIPWPVFHLIRR